MIESLPVADGASELPPGASEGDRAALREAFTTYLRGSFAIDGERYLVVPANRATWVAFRQQGDQWMARQAGARRWQPDWYRAGHDTFAVWTDGGRGAFAMAYAKAPRADGTRLLAYYALVRAD